MVFWPDARPGDWLYGGPPDRMDMDDSCVYFYFFNKTERAVTNLMLNIISKGELDYV